MIPWWVGTLLGSVSLAVKNSMSRVWDMTPAHIALMQIPLLAAGLFYWYGFRNAPKFVNCWFLGTAFNALIAVALGLVFFDKSVSGTTIAGVSCVLTGAYLLIR